MRILANIKKLEKETYDNWAESEVQVQKGKAFVKREVFALRILSSLMVLNIVVLVAMLSYMIHLGVL